jgi:tetraacyldisaccharide 4'-kinase
VQACLPRGLLREPARALGRADALVITRSDQVAPRELDALRAELERAAPGRAHLLGVHRPARLRGPDGRALELAELAGRDLDLVSAIGNPEAFERTLAALGARVASHRVFPDHHRYSPPDLDGLGADGRWLVTTEKDAVKLAGLRALYVLGTDFELVEGAAVLEAQLDALPSSDERKRRDALHEGLHG